MLAVALFPVPEKDIPLKYKRGTVFSLQNKTSENETYCN